MKLPRYPGSIARRSGIPSLVIDSGLERSRDNDAQGNQKCDGGPVHDCALLIGYAEIDQRSGHKKRTPLVGGK